MYICLSRLSHAHVHAQILTHIYLPAHAEASYPFTGTLSTCRRHIHALELSLHIYRTAWDDLSHACCICFVKYACVHTYIDTYTHTYGGGPRTRNVLVNFQDRVVIWFVGLLLHTRMHVIWGAVEPVGSSATGMCARLCLVKTGSMVRIHTWGTYVIHMHQSAFCVSQTCMRAWEAIHRVLIMPT